MSVWRSWWKCLYEQYKLADGSQDYIGPDRQFDAYAQNAEVRAEHPKE